MSETEVAQELVKAWPGCWRVGMRGANGYRYLEEMEIPAWKDDSGFTDNGWLGDDTAQTVDPGLVDISDAATKGALLQGLRELTNRPFLSTRYDPLNGWAVADFSERITGWHESEGVALAKGIIEVRS